MDNFDGRWQLAKAEGITTNKGWRAFQPHSHHHATTGYKFAGQKTEEGLKDCFVSALVLRSPRTANGILGPTAASFVGYGGSLRQGKGQAADKRRTSLRSTSAADGCAVSVGPKKEDQEVCRPADCVRELATDREGRGIHTSPVATLRCRCPVRNGQCPLPLTQRRSPTEHALLLDASVKGGGRLN